MPPRTRSHGREAPPAPTTDDTRFEREREPVAREPLAREPADPAVARTYREGMAAGPAPARGSAWRETVMTASGLNFVAGIWLIIAPWVLGYNNGDPYWNDVLFGALIAIFAGARMAGAFRESGLSLINAAIGVWLFASAFWLDNTGTAGANDIILGIVVFVLALISMSASEDARDREHAGTVPSGGREPLRR